MVWAGSAPTSRELAAGVAVAAWSLLSIPAFTGGRRRTRTVVMTAPVPVPADSAQPADSAESAVA